MITPNEKQKKTIRAKKESLSLVKTQYDTISEGLNSYVISIIEGSDVDTDKEWILDDDLNIKEKEVDLD
jgi:hypothetical protein|tara:strand:+ start:231 stop:437 length:207 start_codon:yes stop_codon:yes gene_type:complete